MSVTRASGLIILAGLALGCSSSRSEFSCASSAQCVSGGEQGMCADGFCAFPDPSCPGGMRYEPNAGDGLGGECLPAPPDPPLACGAAGEACCSSGAACGDHMFCDGSKCTSCVTDLVLGRRSSCVLANDLSIWCSGANAKGQLGSGNVGMSSATRVQVRDSAGNPIRDATAIGAGNEHACAVRTGGAVWCWGANELGQLGNNATLTVPPAPPPPSQPSAVPVVMANGMPLTNIVEIGAGMRFTCARDRDGGVWCWGDNGRGVLGDGTTTTRSTATRVLDAAMGPPLTGALKLYVGGRTACVHKAGDAVWCWGGNNEGQFGDTTQTNHPSPVLLTTTKELTLGRRHTCYVEADSTITCFGWNGHSRLGIGTGSMEGPRLTREKVLTAPGGPPFTGAAAVAAGGVTCALMRDTGVFCWGDNPYGQTGTGQGELVPGRVILADGTPLTGVERLIAGFPHVCALKTTGEILCWGRNNDGDLGDGAFANRGFPSPIENTCR